MIFLVDDVPMAIVYAKVLTSVLIPEIQNLKISTFTVDLNNQHTNIVHVQINGNNDITSRKVTERLALVSQSEASSDCKATNGLGVVVLGSAKPDSKTIRFVLHNNVNDDDLRLAVKKIQFVLREMDRNK